jgi:hypothetical protein
MEKSGKSVGILMSSCEIRGSDPAPEADGLKMAAIRFLRPGKKLREADCFPLSEDATAEEGMACSE